MMDKLISQQAAIDAFYQYPNINWTTLDVMEKIKELPSVQPERKTGHWIPVTNGRGGHKCNRCGCYAPSYQSGTEWLSNFCPECNADMRGEGVI